MKISIIAAIGNNRELGKDNKLLWSIPEDMKRFKQLTSGYAVIMGQRTFESIGKPLSNRLNIILTQDPKFKAPDCLVCYSIPDVLTVLKFLKGNKVYIPLPYLKKLTIDLQDIVKQINLDEAFVIGGGMIYKQFLPLADRLYLTLVKGEYEADTFFPEYETIFTKKAFEAKNKNESYQFTFIELTR